MKQHFPVARSDPIVPRTVTQKACRLREPKTKNDLQPESLAIKPIHAGAINTIFLFSQSAREPIQALQFTVCARLGPLLLSQTEGIKRLRIRDADHSFESLPEESLEDCVELSTSAEPGPEVASFGIKVNSPSNTFKWPQAPLEDRERFASNVFGIAPIVGLHNV